MTHRLGSGSRSRRLAWLAAVVVAVVLVSASAAAAHVEVVPGSAARGSSSILSFSVPNERDDANTVKLEVTLPSSQPIPSVMVKPMPGWTIVTEKTKLAKPVQTDDGEVTEAVSKITWTATAGGLHPGEFDLFTISAGPLPTKGRSMTFKALQTYSDGQVVSWIQTAVKGTPAPDHPAPVLTLTRAARVT
jgi:uncharacterized protein YcnI